MVGRSLGSCRVQRKPGGLWRRTVAVASGFQNRGYTVGIKAGGRGDITTTHSLWKSTRYSADCPTPVIIGGHLFSIRDDGMASCLNLKTGEALWQERLFTENVKVSPVVAAVEAAEMKAWLLPNFLRHPIHRVFLVCQCKEF